MIAQLLDAGIPLDPPCDDPDLAIDEGPFVEIVRQLIMSGRTADEFRAEFCARALVADGMEEARLLRNVNKFVPKPEWPARRLLIPAIDTHTGELTVFDQDTGVDFVEAVAAACAVPGVWAPITIGDTRYLDAIIRSPVNPDLLAPVRATGEVMVIAPHEASRGAIGRDQGDLSRRPDATRAGMAQARELADAVTALWGD